MEKQKTNWSGYLWSLVIFLMLISAYDFYLARQSTIQHNVCISQYQWKDELYTGGWNILTGNQKLTTLSEAIVGIKNLEDELKETKQAHNRLQQLVACLERRF